jgi:DNA-binding transcriptional LysR family regulator
MLRYTLRQIEYAVAVADHSSVAAAAETLGIAQPSVSAAIMKLEEQIGVQLFLRHHAQGVSPTPLGGRFLAEARSLLSHAQEFQREAESAGATISGELKIASFMTMAPAFVPSLLSQFWRCYPLISLRLEDGTQTELLDSLRSGRSDVALLYDVDLPDDLRVTRLATFDPYVLLPASHRLARRKKVSLRDLADEPFILLDIVPSRSYFTRIIESQGITPRIAFSSPSLELVRGLVGQGLGYSLLVTRPYGHHTYDGNALALRPIAEEVEKGIAALVALRQIRPTRLVAAFEAFCVTFFQELK